MIKRVTPAQEIMAYCAVLIAICITIAVCGVAAKAIVVASIVDSNGEVKRE